MYIGNDASLSKFNELYFLQTEYHFVCHMTMQQHFNPLSPNSDQDQFLLTISIHCQEIWL